MSRKIFAAGLSLCLMACSSDVTAESSVNTTMSSNKINITVGNTVMTATLTANSSATAFLELLEQGPVTVQMSDYGDFEKVGSLPTSLPTNDERITTSAGDIILYQGNSITIYYDTNTWSFTRLGKIDNLTQAELKAILGDGSITAVFSIASSGVASIKADSDREQTIYTLDGRRLSSADDLAHGIYIIDGKKVMK